MGDPERNVERLMDRIEKEIIGRDLIDTREILEEINEKEEVEDVEAVSIDEIEDTSGARVPNQSGFEEFIVAIRILNSQIEELRAELDELKQEISDSKGPTFVAGVSVEGEADALELYRKFRETDSED